MSVEQGIVAAGVVEESASVSAFAVVVLVVDVIAAGEMVCSSSCSFRI